MNEPKVSLTDAEKEEIKLFCEEHSISILNKTLGFGCVKILPDSNSGKDRFFSFSVLNHPSRFSWGSSIWTVRNSQKKLKLYIDSSCGLSIMEGLKLTWKVFENA